MTNIAVGLCIDIEQGKKLSSQQKVTNVIGLRVAFHSLSTSLHPV